jgi:YjbE family integral membrane protein
VDSILSYADVESISILGEVLVINIILSGDNAMVVAMAAVGLPPKQRLKALWLGIGLATVLRVFFALVATALLRVTGMLFAGGILLLWVSWKLWREIMGAHTRAEAEAEALLEGKPVRHLGPKKTMTTALCQIALADLSMSLDNVLAVAGAAMEHPVILAIGLVISVLLTGLAAALIASLLERYRWIAYIGLLLVVYVAIKMIWIGASDLLASMTA